MTAAHLSTAAQDGMIARCACPEQIEDATALVAMMASGSSPRHGAYATLCLSLHVVPYAYIVIVEFIVA